ncbi:hypothetical protein CMI39_00240 [Candidatus Pacearchaeota archaeon]|jgi:hypothetical protein|nr:hypothetical protein [Candidatus Pacearchaeota archaeon]|tara:strand:+ start:243 stop:770 length:528 start_codon:yes stop_codon:yes gene_type:complete
MSRQFFPYSKTNREGGSWDLVTYMKLQETNDSIKRGALINGFNMLQSSERHGDSPIDAVDLMTVAGDFDASRTGEWRGSFKNIESSITSNFVKKNYERDPESIGLLNERHFNYNHENKSYELNVQSTLEFCKVKKDNPNFGRYQSMLEAELDLGNNAILLKDAVNEEVGEFNIIF